MNGRKMAIRHQNITKNLGESGALLDEVVGALRVVGAGLHLLRPALLLLLHDALILRLRPALLLLNDECK